MFFTFINKVGRVFLGLGSSLVLTDQASEAMYWIGNDFRNAKASSMGNNGYNSGFENPLGPNISPDGWEDLTIHNVIKTTPEMRKIRSGFVAIGLPLGTTYYSDISTTTYNSDYILSAWINNETGGYGECRLLDNNNVNFLPPIYISTITVTGTTYWMHVTSIVNIAANTPFKFRLIHPWGHRWHKRWHSSPSMFNSYYQYASDDISPLGIFQNELYTAIYINPLLGSYKNLKFNGRDWFTISTNGFIGLNTDIFYHLSRGMNAIFNNKVYMIIVKGGVSPAGIIWNFNGISWTSVASNAFSPASATSLCSGVDCYSIYKGAIFAGGFYGTTPIGPGAGYFNPGIWSSVDGNIWQVVYNPALLEGRICHFCIYNNRLYAVEKNNGLLVTIDGINWLSDNDFFNASSILGAGLKRYMGSQGLCIYNNKLYAGVSYSNGFASRLFFYDGISWQPGPVLSDVCGSLKLYNFNDKLYIATNDTNGGKIYVFDGVGCTLDYSFNIIPDANKLYINSFIEFKGLLYANYSYRFLGVVESGILQLGGYTLFDDISLSPQQVIFSSSTADTDYEYYTCKDISDNDVINRFKRYRLYYDQLTRKLYRQKYKGPGVDDWKNVSPAPLCENVLKLTITNNKQESFAVELLLEKDIGNTGKKKIYKINSTFTPAVP